MNVSFLTNVSPGAQDQLHSLWEPVQNQMWDPLFSKYLDFKTGRAPLTAQVTGS